MKKLILAGVAGLALAAASPALASRVVGPVISNDLSGPIFPSNSTMVQACNSLESDFDQLAPSAKHVPNMPGAKMLRRDGAKMCRAGQYSAGIMTLHSALQTLGVAPMNDTDPLQDGVV